MPIPSKSPLRLVIDGQSVYSGSVVPLGHVLHVVRRDGRWQLGFPQPPSERTDSSEWEKSKGLSGPITDAYFGAMVHVYGTQKPADTEALKKAAEKGAKGWPLWLWDFEQPVVKDTDVTDAIMRDAHVVLYATPGSNRVLERILGRLPITIDGDAVVMAQQRYTARGVGTRFIFPNPLNPKRYVIVQAAPDTDGVMAGHRLPDFVADYVIYDANATRVRPRLIAGNGRPLASGFFDRFWRVPGAAPLNRNPASPEPGTVSALPIPPAPPAPPKPEAFLAPKGDPAGTIARKLADRVYGFPNFRAEIPGATWTLNLGARWDVRRARQCLRSLHQHGVVVVSADQPPTPVPTPVEVTGAVGGVTFHSMHPDRPVILACEMADRLPILAGVLRKHGVSGAEVMSSYRETPKVSFHTLGLALDLAAFHTRRQTLSVAKHFERTPAYETCRAPEAHRREGQSLLDIACAIAETGHFSSVLTPNYNTGHKDHFHLDARPHDPRLFVR
ncbi:MAG: extensin family protein [Myxococcales bacterium]|nr:extensin family protein [Myxococcales bacterium]